MFRPQKKREAREAYLGGRDPLVNAQGKGALIGATAVGMEAKLWLLSNDEGICVICQRNAAQKWIPIDQLFQSGDAAPIAHPRCRCDAAYKRKLPEN